MLQLRPYELLCLVCSLGDEERRPEGKLAHALDTIHANPDIPITLVCTALDVYVYQDPGLADDTPEGADYNRKRDLDVLQRLDLAPGSTLPARTLLMRLLKHIPRVAGICGYETVTSEAWQGCASALAGFYERGQARGITAFIPSRDKDEMLRDKQLSVEAMERAERLAIRPHVAMCAVCNWGNNRGQPEPLANDNIVEFIAIIRRRPDVLVTMAQGADWMICAPCPVRVPHLNACVNVLGSGGLSNEKRDLDLLQQLGLTFGSTLPGRELLLLLFDKVPTTQSVCARDNTEPSVWWDGCGEHNAKEGNHGYDWGREALRAEFAQ